jgi:hypothetical protein
MFFGSGLNFTKDWQKQRKTDGLSLARFSTIYRIVTVHVRRPWGPTGKDDARKQAMTGELEGCSASYSTNLNAEDSCQVCGLITSPALNEEKSSISMGPDTYAELQEWTIRNWLRLNHLVTGPDRASL